MNTLIVKYKTIPQNYNILEILSENFAIIYADINIVKNDENIIQYEIPIKTHPMLAESKEKSCITIGGNNVGSLSGKGVIVGIIDSGITYNHREFGNRIIYIWDIPLNRVYNQEEINQGIDFSDINGHGTAVAGIVAGSSGIAYGADIIAVAIGRGSSEDIMKGIKFIENKSRELNKPFVINISYGTNFGSHNGQSLFEQYIDEVCENNVASIVVASGNEGDKSHHYSGKGNSTVEFNVGNSIKTVSLEMWKNYLYNATIEIISPNGDTTSVLSGRDILYSQILQNTNIEVNIQIPTPNIVEEKITITLTGKNFVDSGIWKLVIDTNENLEYDIWLPVSEGVDENTIFLSPNIYTTLTIPSTAFRAITVGGYNSNNYTIAPFSGRGNTREVVFSKPDVVAPAVNIRSASNTGGYDFFTGTSFAAPFVSGVAALLMEWGIVNKNDSQMYGERIKALIRRYAIRDTTRQYPNREWGYGRLCFKNIYDNLGGISAMNVSNEALSEDYVSLIVERSDETYRRLVNSDTATCVLEYGNYIVLFIKTSNYELLLTNPQVGSGIRSATPIILGLINRNYTIPDNLISVQNLPADYRGNGVLVGIADTGIDINDSAFKYENGDSRIYSMWVQDDDEQSESVCFGREYTREEITEGNINIEGDILHGTNMAKAVQKVAPDVEFVIVKLKNAKNYYKRQLGIDENIPAFESSDLMLAIDYILKKSSEAKKPTSIVIGIGSNQGGHDGLNILESYLSQIAINNGISIITATGNEALSGRHTSFEINSDKGYEDVEINVGQNTKNFALWIWSDITDRVDVAIIPPLGNSIGRIEARNNFINTYKINITDTTVRVEYRIPLYRTSSQVTMIYVDKAVSGIWTIRVYGNTVLGKINCWLPITEFASDIKFLSPNVNTTLVTPSTAFNVMSVGGYDTISNKMIPSSGRGPTRDGRLKPDFVAPTNYSTSISASISAGVAALLLEWGIVRANNFNLNTISIKSYIMQGAVPLSSGDITPNNICGYGAINLYNAFDKL